MRNPLGVARRGGGGGRSSTPDYSEIWPALWCVTGKIWRCTETPKAYQVEWREQRSLAMGFRRGSYSKVGSACTIIACPSEGACLGIGELVLTLVCSEKVLNLDLFGKRNEPTSLCCLRSDWWAKMHAAGRKIAHARTRVRTAVT